jgi:hypothetical protein
MTQAARSESTAGAGLYQFDGFPYLNTRLVPALYHITLLPAGAPESTLLALAQRQARANRLDTCLLLHAHRAVFFWTNGEVTSSHDTPRGGTLLSNRLALSVDLLHTDELCSRQSRLDRIVADGRQKGARFFINHAKGGREATADELEWLRGQGPEGVPRGLERCGWCGDFRGQCLDTSEELARMVVPVYCRCANHNRCARCSLALYERRLNANFYDPRDRRIWHVPGFCGLSHECSAPGCVML